MRRGHGSFGSVRGGQLSALVAEIRLNSAPPFFRDLLFPGFSAYFISMRFFASIVSIAKVASAPESAPVVRWM
jgi:hypothetical protein